MSFTSLIWFRHDLRIHDHTALWHACQAGTTLAVVLLSPQQWQCHHDAAIKLDFYLRQLAQLQQQLHLLNIPLLIQIAPLWEDCAESLSKIALQYQIQAIYANIEVGIHEQQRDQLVQTSLVAQGCAVHYYHDRSLFALGSIRNQNQQSYQVFGAFKKQCYALLSVALPKCFPPPSPQHGIQLPQAIIPSLKALIGVQVCEPQRQLWPVGEGLAFDILEDFVQHQLQDYPHTRDFPAQYGTSQLSAYLNVGILSIRQCLTALFRPYANEFFLDNRATATWLDELLWREFYQHIVFDFPQVSKHLPFKAATQHIIWRNAPQDLQAWQQGQTGIPIVDAGMRQLLATGWMHNRVRMIVAMFLTKNLLIDWRLGEQWFMQHLIDGDLAANNGGWQWCASTGTDAVPYFRIFNPIRQAQKFDPNGDYIRRWVPELAHLDAPQIYDPYLKHPQLQLNYPRPIVDLNMSRQRAIRAFKTLEKNPEH